MGVGTYTVTIALGLEFRVNQKNCSIWDWGKCTFITVPWCVRHECVLRSHGSGVQNMCMATGMEVVILVWGKNVVVGGRFGGVHMVALSQWGHNGGRFFGEVAISAIWGGVHSNMGARQL